MAPTTPRSSSTPPNSSGLRSPGSFAAQGNVFLTGPEALIFGRLAAVCGAALILLIVRWTYKALRQREGLGLGDVKLLAMIAAFLGFWPAILTLFLATLLATALRPPPRPHPGRAGRPHPHSRFGSFLGSRRPHLRPHRRADDRLVHQPPPLAPLQSGTLRR